MSFDVPADAYDSFMGRYSRLLAGQMADLAGVTEGQHVLDVGCGPGALTAELVGRVGAATVTAVDPSEPFVAAIRLGFRESTSATLQSKRCPSGIGRSMP